MTLELRTHYNSRFAALHIHPEIRMGDKMVIHVEKRKGGKFKTKEPINGYVVE